MSEDKGFTVHDRRRVKPDDASAETKGEHPGEVHRERNHPPEQGRGPGDRDTRAGAQRLPPVDFSGFVLGLAQMALIHLGEIPEPGTGKVQRDLEQARHTIDILDMLKEKTDGNLKPEEASLLQHLRSELKLKYVAAAKR